MRNYNIRPILLILLLVTLLLSGSMAIAMVLPTISNTVTATGVVLSPMSHAISLILDGAWGSSVTFTYGNEDHNDFVGGDVATVHLQTLNHLDRPLTVTSVILLEKLSGTNAPLQEGHVTFTYNGSEYLGEMVDSGIQYTVTRTCDPAETIQNIGLTFNNAHWKNNPSPGNGNGNRGSSPERSSEFRVTLVSTTVTKNNYD